MDDEQRIALADLLGIDRLPDESPVVTLRALEQAVQEAVGAGVREVVSDLVGPIEDRAARRTRSAAERAELWSWLEGHEVVSAQPALLDWVAAVRRAGLIGGSVARTRHEVGQALRVLANLPAAGTPLPVLADALLHDPHALDEGTRCAGLVLRALATIYEVHAPVDAQQRRVLWERAGVADDALSSTVLAAGLRPSGDGVGDAVLRLCADAGCAASLTLDQVRSATSLTGAAEDVWVFENPSVLALALAKFGTSCPQIVCTAGWPSSAGILLLRNLAAVGCRLHYHGDFDGEGLRIAAHVLARTGATPWHMHSEDYLFALRDGRSGPPVGRVTEAPWDQNLATHLRQHGIAVSDERLAELLLTELGRRHATSYRGCAPHPSPPGGFHGQDAGASGDVPVHRRGPG